ncbi:hypothetical protein HMPREF9446_00893 [Bacteroides fluxus YIT 12057]|uniref:Uncharacterized protein n=1 Tax=Bacteroides fluxus YIT 12057 TaxID=763034 RepID=F3PQA0_9BACE|nr:hypothetical protein HMPREF9446_00893 [Bacteroides fluxus YIT 12057]
MSTYASIRHPPVTFVGVSRNRRMQIPFFDVLRVKAFFLLLEKHKYASLYNF